MGPEVDYKIDEQNTEDVEVEKKIEQLIVLIMMASVVLLLNLAAKLLGLLN